MNRGLLKDRVDIINYLLAGRGVLTLKNLTTGTHLTFKIAQPKLKEDEKDRLKMPFFVKVLTGSDNETSYTFLGTFWFDENTDMFTWRHGKRSSISKLAPSARTFPWFLKHISESTLPDKVEVYHEGVCGMCGRKLTVPASIERGIGPTCAGGLR